MLVYVHGAKCVGIQAVPVTVEVDITLGIGIHLVGLADAAVKESLLRTVTALQAKGFRIPGKKIVINSKTGNITVKKGLKKGTYKVKVKVTAAGNTDYKKVTKTVTFKIKVK